MQHLVKVNLQIHQTEISRGRLLFGLATAGACSQLEKAIRYIWASVDRRKGDALAELLPEGPG